MTRTAAVRRLAGTAVLAGAALLAAAPADARVAPEDPGSTAPPAAAAHLTKAQVEHAEQQAADASNAGPAALVVKARVERAERAMRDPQRATPGGRSNPATPSTPSDPSSVPVTVLALLGGGLVAAGAAGYTVYRYRHHGPVGAATA